MNAATIGVFTQKKGKFEKKEAVIRFIDARNLFVLAKSNDGVLCLTARRCTNSSGESDESFKQRYFEQERIIANSRTPSLFEIGVFFVAQDFFYAISGQQLLFI